MTAQLFFVYLQNTLKYVGLHNQVLKSVMAWLKADAETYPEGRSAEDIKEDFDRFQEKLVSCDCVLFTCTSFLCTSVNVNSNLCAQASLILTTHHNLTMTVFHGFR
jgi:hypothetical protein